jgi:anti-sigma factor RsiW
MTRKKTSSKSTHAKMHHGHRHGIGRCLRILERLSAYIDDELATNVCQEVRQHIGACPNCEIFVASLRHTIALCRHTPAAALSSVERRDLREGILRAAQARAQP